MATTFYPYLYPSVGIGDVSFSTNDQELCDAFEGWTCDSYPSRAPKSFSDCFDSDLIDWIKNSAEDQAAMALAATAFPAEIQEELDAEAQAL